MKKFKKIFIALIILIILGIVFMSIFSNKASKKINIAVSKDSSGLLINYMSNLKGNNDFNVKDTLSTYNVSDCCSNSTGMGLASKSFDIALMCPYSADVLVKKDTNFEILGPCILDTNVFVFKNKDLKDIKKVGISAGREYEKEYVYKTFGENVEIVPMLNQALGYSLEKGSIDCMLTDSLKTIGFQSSSYKIIKAPNTVAYVLVINNDFKKDKRYSKFLDAFNEAAKNLNNEDVFIKELEKYKNIEIAGKEVKTWEKMKIKFVPISIKKS